MAKWLSWRGRNLTPSATIEASIKPALGLAIAHFRKDAMKNAPSAITHCVRQVFRLVALATALAAPLTYADEYSDVNQLVRSGKLAEALTKADQYLVSKPRDPQMRFLKGVIQTESGKPTDAIGTFVKLTEDYPELPEPYNNLAVLYASQGQYDKARAALEMAIRTNPSYATAHENLGDVYAKLASQAYSKALQLDSSNTGVQPKLALIGGVFALGAKGVRPTAPAVTPATQTPTTAPAGTPGLSLSRDRGGGGRPDRGHGIRGECAALHRRARRPHGPRPGLPRTWPVFSPRTAPTSTHRASRRERCGKKTIADTSLASRVFRSSCLP